MRVVTVVGNRPQFVKAAAVSRRLREHHDELLVHTGQHYDDDMSRVFFEELALPRADRELGVGSASAPVQTGRMLESLDQVLADARPDLVIVYGDTNSTLAGALSAAKLGIPVAHVEAGLRSFDRRMPEELNRVVVDHLSRWLFVPTPTAVANLAAEGIVEGVRLVGDLMQDLAARVAAGVRDPGVLDEIGARLGTALEPGGYVFATVHRAENRVPDALRSWTSLLGAVGGLGQHVVLALHPGTRGALAAEGIELPETVRVVEPQGYRTTLALQLHSAAVLTDSGGVQREAAWLGVPCLVLRPTTEWVEAVAESGGRMVVVGLDVGRAVAELDRLAGAGTAASAARIRAAELDLRPAGAAEAIVASLERDA